jgi:hypothetical protein
LQPIASRFWDREAEACRAVRSTLAPWLTPNK